MEEVAAITEITTDNNDNDDNDSCCSSYTSSTSYLTDSDDEGEDDENDFDTLEEDWIEFLGGAICCRENFYPVSTNSQNILRRFEQLSEEVMETFECCRLVDHQHKYIEFVKPFLQHMVNKMFVQDIYNIRNHILTAELLWSNLMVNLEDQVINYIYNEQIVMEFIDLNVKKHPTPIKIKEAAPPTCQICTTAWANMNLFGCFCSEPNTCYDCFIRYLTSNKTFWSIEKLQCLICRCPIELEKSTVYTFEKEEEEEEETEETTPAAPPPPSEEQIKEEERKNNIFQNRFSSLCGGDGSGHGPIDTGSTKL